MQNMTGLRRIFNVMGGRTFIQEGGKVMQS